MTSYLRLIVRFSHVFFISTCCQSHGTNPIQEDIEGPRFSVARSDVQTNTPRGVLRKEEDEVSSEESFEEVSIE